LNLCFTSSARMHKLYPQPEKTNLHLSCTQSMQLGPRKSATSHPESERAAQVERHAPVDQGHVGLSDRAHKKAPSSTCRRLWLWPALAGAARALKRRAGLPPPSNSGTCHHWKEAIAPPPQLLSTALDLRRDRDNRRVVAHGLRAVAATHAILAHLALPGHNVGAQIQK